MGGKHGDSSIVSIQNFGEKYSSLNSITNLAKRELTRLRRQSLSMLRSLKVSSLMLFVRRRARNCNGAVEQTSNINQVDMYL